DLFVGKTLLHGDVLMWLMKTLLTSGCTNQRGAGHSKAFQVGEWGCFYTIYNKFVVVTKGPKTNLSSGKSQQKQ
ncbi:hypothetical protein, partial [Klebsiella variicola]|uniref:hypothetical protein n=1 Tax=Klebsiella variicola TaxID=244366 RepID=UPI001C558D4C